MGHLERAAPRNVDPGAAAAIKPICVVCHPKLALKIPKSVKVHLAIPIGVARQRRRQSQDPTAASPSPDSSPIPVGNSITAIGEAPTCDQRPDGSLAVLSSGTPGRGQAI